MSEVTQILSAIERGQPQRAEELLPLVYDELRRLAGSRIAREAPGQTLQATALVHEAFVRLVDTQRVQRWDSRGHFFAAAAEAMRRILIERARTRASVKHGGRMRREESVEELADADRKTDELLALDEALEALEAHDPRIAKLVKLRCFAGLSHQDAALALGVSRRVADRWWALAKAWLFQQISKE